ncbi:hypothetical protein Tco_0939603 [Tanacetum coccineum]|uniref:Uncharacterized protein n=1 Tax=Tanacetum coccineum TaxID=301880 RepID=A0ABQ5DM93_9ASTR
MNHHSLAAADDEVEEYSDDFTCCVCLDIIYKPVVLAMDFWQESRCPVCRYSYHHFPSICWLLHSVLLKLYPKVYQTRESQVTAEIGKVPGGTSHRSRKLLGRFTLSEKTLAYGQEHGKDCAVSESLEPPPDNICTKNKEVNENCSSGSDHKEDCYKQVNITDLLCAICKELLCRPVVLNCGHGHEIMSRPRVCQSSHPKGFPKVCLVLEGFLEQHVSEEYAARRQAIDKLKTREQGTSSAGSTKVQQGGQCSSVPMIDYLCPDVKAHFGVGFTVFCWQCARKVAPIRSPTGIGAGLGEHLAPMERPDKIPIKDQGGFEAWFVNRVWGWKVIAPPQTRPITIPKFTRIYTRTTYIKGFDVFIDLSGKAHGGN